MNKKTILNKLKDDENYYGSFGKKFLSNSDIGTLLSNPLALGSEVKSSPAILIGKYFHTALLEPDKLKDFKVIAAATRNTKVYKDQSEGELCLLQSEVDMVKSMTDKIVDTRMCKDLINKNTISKLKKIKWTEKNQKKSFQRVNLKS